MECTQQRGDAMIHKARDNCFRLIFSEPELRNTYQAKGIAKGIAEGRGDERIAIARRSLEKHMPIEDIVSITGLSYKEVEDLTKQ